MYGVRGTVVFFVDIVLHCAGLPTHRLSPEPHTARKLRRQTLAEMVQVVYSVLLGRQKVLFFAALRGRHKKHRDGVAWVVTCDLARKGLHTFVVPDVRWVEGALEREDDVWARFILARALVGLWRARAVGEGLSRAFLCGGHRLLGCIVCHNAVPIILYQPIKKTSFYGSTAYSTTYS